MMITIKTTLTSPFKIWFLLCLSLPTLLGCNPTKKTDSRLNIVWIIADDYSQDAEIFNTPEVSTPNMQRLAREGILFTNAFATSPVCSPSRSAFYTGAYQTTTGTHQHRTNNRYSLPDSLPVITKYFQQAGYFTCNGYGHPESKKGKTDFNFKVEKPFEGTDWSQRTTGQPFFASVQIKFPHRSFKALDSLSNIDPDNIELPPYYPDHPVSRIDWAMYLQSVQEMDKELGRVISRLENEGLLENTAIFFFADHGRPHVRDKQWLYDGGIQVPLIVRFPNKKRAGEKNNRLVSLIDVPAASLSLAEINLPQALQGVNFLNGPSQRSFVYAARDRTDAVVDRIRCIRTSNLKYIRNYMPERPYTQFSHYKTYHYPVLTLMKSLHEKGELDPEQAHFMANTKPIEELYDLTQDPYELVNLAHDQTYQEELLALRDTLERFTSEIGDVGAYDPDDLEEVLKRRRKKYGKRWKKRNIDPHETPISEYLEWWERKLKIRN